jgi:hypothetical protein
MVKRRLHGRMLMLALYTHSTIGSTSVAVVRWVDVAASREEGTAKRVREKVQIVASLVVCKSGHSPYLPRPPLVLHGPSNLHSQERAA